MEGGRGMEGLAYFIITLACVAGVPVLILICSLIVRAQAEMKLKNLHKKYRVMLAQHQELLMEKVAVKNAFMKLSDEYPGLYAEYEREVQEFETK